MKANLVFKNGFIYFLMHQSMQLDILYKKMQPTYVEK